MYLHKAMRESDRAKVLKAMRREIDDEVGNGNDQSTPIVRSKGSSILPTVWRMKRKCDITTRQVKKWKARLNINGSRMKQGVHYDQTYAPMAS